MARSNRREPEAKSANQGSGSDDSNSLSAESTSIQKKPLWKRIFFWSAPLLTAFIASFCIMVLELVAGRVIARYLGSSLHTWTSVIGIVLAGITIGNFFGGRLADWFRPATVLAVLFLLASGACLSVPIINQWVYEMDSWTSGRGESNGFVWLLFQIAGGEERLPWSARIFGHVFLVFLFPSTLLGAIGPVVAKMALDQGYRVGHTVGNVYAWGAFGSIIGTFVTGYFLISAMGTVAVIISVGIVLGLMGVLYSLTLFWSSSKPAAAILSFLTIFPAFFMPLMAIVAFIYIQKEQTSWPPWELVERNGTTVIREKLKNYDEDGERVEQLYVDESQYAYMRIESEFEEEEGVEREVSRSLSMDSLIHAYLTPGDPKKLQYDYELIYRAITHRFAPPDAQEEEKMACFYIGGGGYIFPRYVRAVWPGAYQEVAEIDPAVTHACVSALDLNQDEIQIVQSASDRNREGNPIWIYHLDARNHIDDLIRRLEAGKPVRKFDFVYGDAFNFLGVPFHLTTLEFNQKVKRLLKPESGIYMINIIDIFESGKFLGAVYNTFCQTFGKEKVYVYCTHDDGPSREDRDTFIVVGSMQPLDLEDLPGEEDPYDFEGSQLTKEHLGILTDDQHAGRMILLDNHAPVENLLQYVVDRWKS